MSRPGVRIALWSALAVALSVTAYLLMNTTFMIYDDEGYVLISLRNYLAGLRLYDDVFSQYGPWPFVYHELVTTVLHADMTHTLGRALTVFHWVATALLCGAVGWRLTRNQIAAMVIAVVTFNACWQNTSEPNHPGSHIITLIALAAVIVSGLPGSRRPGTAYAALGIIAGLLILTKINVGLLFVAGLGCFVLRYTAWPENWRRVATASAIAGLLAVPWILLGRQLGHGWVLIFAIQFTLAAAGLLWLSPADQVEGRLPARVWLVAPVACVLAGGLVCFRVWLQGTSFDSMLDATLIKPLRMPANFVVGMTWYPEVWAITVAGVLAAAKAGYEIRTRGRPTNSSIWIVAVLRCIVLGVFVWRWRVWASFYGIFHFSVYCLPLLPLFLVPLTNRIDDPRRLSRWGVACLALPQVLHAFPVAGSQLAWASFLCVPLLIVGLFDLGEVLPSLMPRAARRVAQAGAVILVLTAGSQLALLGYTGWQRYVHSRPLDLPNAGDIRLGGEIRQTFRLLNLNARIHADLLFSRQGMFSQNIWSGVPTPTAQNATHWFWLLDDKRQNEIVSRLAATPHTALITSESLDSFMVKQKVPVVGPLQDFVQSHYRPLFRHTDFTFHVPATSHAVVFGRYELLSSATDMNTVLFRSNVLIDGSPARINMEQFNSPWAEGPELLTPQSQAIAEPIDRDGRPIGAPVKLPADRPLRGLYRLSIICPALPPKLPWQDYTVMVRDAEGRLLSDSVY